MDNRNLYFIFLYAMYWLWEMIKDVLSLIFVLPYRIFRSALSMDTSEAIPFIKGEIHSHFNRMKVHGLTVSLIINNGKPSLNVRSYFEEVKALSDQINNKKYRNTHKLIEDALLTMKKCMYVTLQSNETGMKFIQFHNDSGTYYFDFPLTPRTLNRDYSSDIIHLLRERGFTKYNRVRGYAFKYKTYTIYPLEEELTTVNAEFGNDLKLAVDTSTYIFEKIFQSKQTPNVIFG